MVNSRLISAVLGTLLFALSTQVNAAFKGRGGISYSGDNICTVTDIPEYIRNVPIHPDDTYVSPSNAGPIRDSTLECSNHHLYSSALGGLEKKFGSYSLFFGLGIRLTLFDEVSIVKRNYTNAVGTETRGYGAALTYYALREGKNYYFINAHPELSLQINVDLGSENSIFKRFFLEYNMLKIPLYIETGWDRYDKLEKKTSHRIADMDKSLIKIGLASKAAGRIYIAFVKSHIKETEQNINITADDYVLAGLEWVSD